MLKKAVFAIGVLASPLCAEGKSFTLSAPAALQDTGLLKHMLPRFSLKTGVRITVAKNAGEAAFGQLGKPAFRHGDMIWHFSGDGSPHVARFEEWLFSDVGKRTIDGFAPGGTPLFSSDVAIQEEEEEVELTGDAVLGEAVSLTKCGRCHVVSEKNRMNAIGSTPSFALMRTFGDWEDRFLAFFALKPHPAFTQVEDVTEPFPINRPSPIAPIEVTLDEIEAIVAYVGSIDPADLGAPMEIQ